MKMVEVASTGVPLPLLAVTGVGWQDWQNKEGIGFGGEGQASRVKQAKVIGLDRTDLINISRQILSQGHRTPD
jgi:hypothetical protein